MIKLLIKIVLALVCIIAALIGPWYYVDIRTMLSAIPTLTYKGNETTLGLLASCITLIYILLLWVKATRKHAKYLTFLPALMVIIAMATIPVQDDHTLAWGIYAALALSVLQIIIAFALSGS